MKKWIFLLLALVLVINLASMAIGCKPKAPEKVEKAPAPKEEAKPPETPAPPAPAVTPAPAPPPEAPKK